jgi:hypothetical protein
MSDPTKQSIEDISSLADSALKRRSSSIDLAAVAPSPEMALVNAADATDTCSAEDNRPASSLTLDEEASPEAPPPSLPEKDELLSEYDLLLDQEVAFRYGDLAFVQPYLY